MGGTILRLQSSWTYALAEEGIELFSGINKLRFKIKGNRKNLYALFREFQVGFSMATLSEIAQKCSLNDSTVQKIIDILEKKGAFVARDRALERTDYHELYDRQIRFFDFFETQEQTGHNFHESLINSRVLIIGVGSYGTWLALMCARMGIRNIVLIDHDIVEYTNLNRQILFKREDIGLLKTEAAKRALDGVDPEISIRVINEKMTDADQFAAHLECVDLVFNAFGYYPNSSFNLVRNACLKMGVPVLSFSGSWVGPLTVPGESPCIDCLYDEQDLYDLITASQSRYINKAVDLPNPAFAPRMSIVASVAAWEAARFLSGIDRPKTLDGILMFDFFNYTSTPFRALEKKENCRCSTIRNVQEQN